MRTFFGILLRLICYPALLIVVGGLATMLFLGVSGVCPQFDLTGVQCTSRFYDDLASYGVTLLLLSVFNGYPLVLALGGLTFLVLDTAKLVRWRARKREAEG